MPFITSRRVEFHDTDAAGIMHFSAFFLMMEQAEHDLLRHVGLSVMMFDAQGKIRWPRVSTRCDFRAAARFEDMLQIEVGITRLGAKSVTYAFRFTRGGEELAVGETTAVCCRFPQDKPPISIAIPTEFLQKLQPFVEADGGSTEQPAQIPQ
jgi:4-hydroxybenzoyl-CoA thioesterase/acyl-CoA thioester hydrolase